MSFRDSILKQRFTVDVGGGDTCQLLWIVVTNTKACIYTNIHTRLGALLLSDGWVRGEGLP